MQHIDVKEGVLKMGKYSTFMLNRLSSSTFLELYLLSNMIKRNDAVYGMEILNKINKFDITWRPSHGTLYPVIEDMVKKGLIEFAYKVEAKKYYEITDYGREYYNDRAKEFRKDLVEAARFYRAISTELMV